MHCWPLAASVLGYNETVSLAMDEDLPCNAGGRRGLTSGDGHQCGIAAHLCAAGQRRGQVLGEQLLRAARRWHGRSPRHSDKRVGVQSGATSVSAGAYHTCAVVSGGAKCSGYNDSGGLGDGSTTDRTSPVPVSGLAMV